MSSIIINNRSFDMNKNAAIYEEYSIKEVIVFLCESRKKRKRNDIKRYYQK